MPPAARAGGTMDSRGDLPVAVSFSRYTSSHDMVIIAIALLTNVRFIDYISLQLQCKATNLLRKGVATKKSK